MADEWMPSSARVLAPDWSPRSARPLDAPSSGHVGAGETYINNAIEAPTFGFGKNIVGAGAAGVLAAIKHVPGLAKVFGVDPSVLKDYGQNYEETKKAFVDRTAQGNEENPNAALAGKATGIGLALAAPLPSAEIGADKLAMLGKYAPLASKVASGALTGAGYSALAGAGTSEADTLGGRLEDAAKAVPMGLLLGAAGGVIGRGAEKLFGNKASVAAEEAAGQAPELSQKLQGYADQRAAKAMGGTKTNFRGLDMEDIERHGANLRDMGVPLTGAPQAKLAAVEAKLEENGQNIGQMLRNADDMNTMFQPIPKPNDLAEAAPGLGIRARELPPKQGGFDMAAFVQDARAKILPRMEGDPALATQYRKADRLLDGYEKLGNVPYSRANQLKANLQSTINFASPKADQDVANQLQGIFLDHVDKGLGSELGDAAQSQFKALKSQYGSLKWAKNVLEQQTVPGAVGNRTHGLTDYLAGMVGSAAGTPLGPLGHAVGFAVGMAANNVSRNYGPGLMAYGVNRLAQTAATPSVYQSMGKVGELLSTNSSALGKFGGALKSIAEQHGPEAAAAAHFVLSQSNPEYQKLAQGEGGGE